MLNGFSVACVLAHVRLNSQMENFTEALSEKKSLLSYLLLFVTRNLSQDPSFSLACFLLDFTLLWILLNHSYCDLIKDLKKFQPIYNYRF